MKWTFFLFVAALAVPGISPAFEPPRVSCDPAVLPTDGVVRGYGDPENPVETYSVRVPEPGMLYLEVLVPGYAPAEAKIGLAAGGCGKSLGTLEPARRIEASPTRLLLAVEAPGTYGVRVAAQDPRHRLESFKVTSRFVPAGASVKDGEDEDPSEIEIDPLRGTIPVGLCAGNGGDDHADSPACATPIEPGTAVTGRLGNAWGDDADLFELRLDEVRTVRITSRGDTDTFGTLFDRHGHRLAADDDGGEGGQFLIVKTLHPGSYFLRVEGRNAAEGPYGLDVEASW